MDSTQANWKSLPVASLMLTKGKHEIKKKAFAEATMPF